MTRSENLQKVHYNDNHQGTFGSCNYCQQNIEESKPSHTPTPWHVEDQDIMSGEIEIALVSAYNTNRKANAAYIVKCVNAHEELVRLVRKADNYIRNQERAIPEDHGNDCQYCRALAQAEGK